MHMTGEWRQQHSPSFAEIVKHISQQMCLTDLTRLFNPVCQDCINEWSEGIPTYNNAIQTQVRFQSHVIVVYWRYRATPRPEAKSQTGDSSKQNQVCPVYISKNLKSSKNPIR